MANYTYTGDEVRQFPTLTLTLTPGDTFDASDDFVAADCALTKKAAPVVAPTPTVGA